MATITYQVTIGTGGKPTVSVTSDDPTAARDAIPWLAQTYATLLKDAKAVPSPATTLTVPSGETKESPVCQIHGKRMIRMTGRKGPFWSCHEKMADGSWCSFKP
jgi:hypothetical protein